MMEALEKLIPGYLLSWVGIVVTILLFVLGLLFTKKVLNRKVQAQTVSTGGTGYQAGRDVRIEKEK